MATITIPRIANPATDPAGYTAAAGAVVAAAVMITNAVNGHGIIDTTSIVAAVGAVLALFTRQVVTPVADPKNAAGVPLVPAPAVATVTVGKPTFVPPSTLT